MSDVKKLLHVGCGPKTGNPLPEPFDGPGWKEIRLDLNPDMEPDYVGDICDMKAVADASMDGLWSSHNIEHLFPHDVPRALAEFFRVLNEGGTLAMSMPDMQRVALFVAAGNLEDPLYVSPAGPISAIDMMYGHRPSMVAGNLFMAHKTAFTAKSLATYLLTAGFSDVTTIREGFNLHALAYKRAKQSQPRNQFQIIDKGGPVPIMAAA